MSGVADPRPAGPQVVAAACDGACSGNPGPGGWGCLLRFEDGTLREFGAAAADTTNNRMELTAALTLLEQLRQLPRHPDLTIRTDSKYLIDGYTRWIQGWKRKGWRTAAGAPVLNRDLWEALDAARIPGLPFSYVKGHSGDPDNDRCDAIAVAFSRGGRPPLAQGEDGGVAGDGGVVTAVKTKAGTIKAVTAKAASRQAASVLEAPAVEGAAAVADRAPAALQQLLTRLELADRLAAGGYGLSLTELAQLVEQPLKRLEARRQPWQWRDWTVLPAADGRWQLRRDAAGSGDDRDGDAQHG
jgi:ribonuclease HI